MQSKPNKMFDFDSAPTTVEEARTLGVANRVRDALSVALKQGIEASPREVVEAAMQMIKSEVAKADSSYVAIPQRRGRVHAITGSSDETGTVHTACGRDLNVKSDAWRGEPPYRTGWDYNIDCAYCQRIIAEG